MPKKKKITPKQKYFIAFTWIVCFFIGALLMYVYLHPFWKTSHTKISKNNFVSLLSPLKTELYIKTSAIQPDQAIWVERYSDLRILTGKSFTGINEISYGENIAIKEIVTSYFHSEELLINEINTFTTLQTENPFQVQSLGFTKGETKCLVTVYLQATPSGYYFCGKEDREKNILQKEFMPVLYGPDNKYPLKEDEAAVIDVTKINDRFATGTNNRYMKGIFEPSGSVWIAAKVDGVWKLVSDSQDYPLCTALDAYEVPKEFYSDCYHDKTNTLRFHEM